MPREVRSEAQLLSFGDVAGLPEFRGLSRSQVRGNLIALDGELGGRLLVKRELGGKVHYRVSLANLRAMIPSLFPKAAKELPTAELDERVARLEEAAERQARKLGALMTRVESLAERLAGATLRT